MKALERIASFIFVMSMLGLIIVIYFIWPQPIGSPEYDSRSLQSWLKEYYDNRMTIWDSKEKEAEMLKESIAAVRHIGTNGIPYLLALLPKEEGLYVPYEQSGKGALLGFEILGSEAKPAVPLLIKMLEQTKSEHLQIMAAQALQSIGPAAKEALPVLLSLPANSSAVQYEVIIAVYQIAANESEKMQLMIQCLHNKNLTAKAKDRAVNSLMYTGLEDQPALTTLAALLKDSDRDVRSYATNALERISLEVLTNVLKKIFSPEATTNANSHP